MNSQESKHMSRTVYHTEHGKGKIIAVVKHSKSNVIMCYFPKAKATEFVNQKSLLEDTDEFISLSPREREEDEVSDRIQSALENLFFGGGQKF